jgi:hypothetical protein
VLLPVFYYSQMIFCRPNLKNLIAIIINQGISGIIDKKERIKPNFPKVGGTSIKIPIISPSQPVSLVKILLLSIAIEKRIKFIPPKK